MNDTRENKLAFYTMIGALLEAHGQEATKPRQKAFWMAMKHMTLAQVEMAVTKSLQVDTRVPTPARLIELGTDSNADKLALLAWDEAMKGCRVSYMADLDFEDRRINAVIRTMGGRSRFYELMNKNADSEKWTRIEFIKTYKTLCTSELSDDATRVLIGEADHGKVNGRTWRPRIEVVPCRDKRPLLPPRKEVKRIAGESNVPLVEFQKVTE